ncbi:MAG: response regulator, partial [Candidatus Eisenbacteria bacterium]|nr:response regulator [Candidatus Eisenbacteria bacterium]
TPFGTRRQRQMCIRDRAWCSWASSRETDLILLDRRLPDGDGLELASVLRQERPDSPPVLLLCRPGDAPREVGPGFAGIAGFLQKPLRRSRLISAMQAALEARFSESAPPRVATAGQAPRQDGGRSAGSMPALPSQTISGRSSVPADGAAVSVSAAPARPCRVLVVDDNSVNRKVAARMLGKIGAVTEEAPGGEEAVREWARGGFDLILMDVQMPGMDGYQATEAIRAAEAVRGGRIPIVALTAHALPEDRERCLACGMDEYLSKPVRLEQLSRMVERIMSEREEPAMAPMDEREPLDRSRLEEVSGGDSEFERELLQEFLTGAPKLLAQAQAAAGGVDVPVGMRAAHTLKGSAASVGAVPLSEA